MFGSTAPTMLHPRGTTTVQHVPHPSRDKLAAAPVRLCPGLSSRICGGGACGRTPAPLLPRERTRLRTLLQVPQDYTSEVHVA